jgi:hypothetical protein
MSQKVFAFAKIVDRDARSKAYADIAKGSMGSGINGVSIAMLQI